MISANELNPHKYPTTPEIIEHLRELQQRINVICIAYGKPMVVTSGLRSDAQQKALIASGKSKATKSRHLIGQACDIEDKSGDLGRWCKANVKVLEDVGLWCEALESTVGWVHFQSVPPGSGARFFNP